MSAPSPGSRSSILIVDDMEESLIALQAVLGPLGQHLVSARSGEEALKAMLRQEFAVVLLDVLMPGMDGFETVGNIKRLDQTKDVPVILLTGIDVDTDYAYRGYSLGAADFLAKPVDPWLLRTKVAVFLELHQKNRQLAEQAEQLRRLLTDQAPDAVPAPPGAGPGAGPGPGSGPGPGPGPGPWGQASGAGPGAGAVRTGRGTGAGLGPGAAPGPATLAEATERLTALAALARAHPTSPDVLHQIGALRDLIEGWSSGGKA